MEDSVLEEGHGVTGCIRWGLVQFWIPLLAFSGFLGFKEGLGSETWPETGVTKGVEVAGADALSSMGVNLLSPSIS